MYIIHNRKVSVRPAGPSIHEPFRKTWKRMLGEQLTKKIGDLPYPARAKAYEDAFDQEFPPHHGITPEEFNDFLKRMKLPLWQWNNSSFIRSVRLDTSPKTTRR